MSLLLNEDQLNQLFEEIPVLARWSRQLIERALVATDQTTVPCNNDLLAGNFIEDGDNLWLIDYEYAGNNDPCFELGNVWSECSLTT